MTVMGQGSEQECPTKSGEEAGTAQGHLPIAPPQCLCVAVDNLFHDRVDCHTISLQWHRNESHNSCRQLGLEPMSLQKVWQIVRLWNTCQAQHDEGATRTSPARLLPAFAQRVKPVTAQREWNSNPLSPQLRISPSPGKRRGSSWEPSK